MNSGSKPYLMKSGVLACSRMRSPSTSSCSPPAKPTVDSFNRRSTILSRCATPLDEQDAFRVDRVAAFFATSRAVHHRLDLAGHVVRGAGRHLGFHQLERVVCTPWPLTSRPPKLLEEEAILSISSM